MALYGFGYSQTALAALEKIPKKLKRQIKRRIESLASNPKPPGSRKLKGPAYRDDLIYRVRQGKYRIIYAIRNNPNQIIVLEIDYRKDVYR